MKGDDMFFCTHHPHINLSFVYIKAKMCRISTDDYSGFQYIGE